MIITIVALVGIYNLKKNSADGRALIWKTSIHVILDQPLGVGLGNFAGSYGNAQAEYFASGAGTEQEQYVAGNPEYAFNEYLQMCIEFGIIPFLLFVNILFLAVYHGIKNKQHAALGGLISLLIFSAMSYPLNLLPFVIGLAFLLALCFSKKSGKCLSVKGLKGITISLSISLTIVALCLYNRYPTYDAYKKWNKTKLMYNINIYDNVAKEYKELEPYLDYEIQFLFEYAQSLSKMEQYTQSNQILTKAMKISCDPMLYNIMGKNNQALLNYSEAENNYIKASNLVPGRLYPYYLLAKLYNEMREIDKMYEMATIIETKEIKINSPAIEEMRKEIKDLCNQHETL